MAEKTTSVTMEAIIEEVRLDPINNRVTLQGSIFVKGTQVRLSQYREDVTDSMTQAQIDAALLLVAGAQGWIDSKLP